MARTSGVSDADTSPHRKLRLVIEYDGTDFAGWQRQVQQRTVQGTLEDGIATLVGERVEVRGAGRTDAGVHAAGQVASLALASRIPATGLLRGLNSLLPSDVAIVDAAEVDDAFDARFSARGKVYRYRIWNHLVRAPLHARTSWHCRRPLDLPAMREAARVLCGEHDFRGFRASDCERRNTVRVIRRFDIAKHGALVEIDVEATAFLKNMVRILAGTLADVGRGRRDIAAVLRALEQGDRSAGGVTAPAAGLTVMHVVY
jgi:tRNA pseudouridine38-40 synthase